MNTGIYDPVGIAISKDGTVGYVAQDFNPMFGPGFLYSFPTGGSTHTATTLTPTGTVIANPLFIAISGDYSFVADYNYGLIYSVTFTETTYDATLIQTNAVGGLAISNDGYLYFSSNYDETVYRVPLTDLTASPQLVVGTSFPVDGIALSNDGKTLYLTSISSGGPSGIFSVSIDGNTFGTLTPLGSLDIPVALDVSISPGPAHVRSFERPSNRRL